MTASATIRVRVRRLEDGSYAGTLSIGDWTIPCAIGRGGLKPPEEKREGDGATPQGVFPLRYGLYLPGAWGAEWPADLAFPFVPITDDMVWHEMEKPERYNRLTIVPPEDPTPRISRPMEGRYDIVIPIGFNDASPVLGRGSAIWIHIGRPGLPPSAGCILIARAHALELVRRLRPGMEIDIDYERPTPLAHATPQNHTP